MKTPQNIIIFGLGLMGGSIALDFRKLFPNAKILGIDTNQANINAALELKLIDKIADLDDVFEADIIVLAIFIEAICEILPNILAKVKPNTLVFDVGSTKNSICKSVENHQNRANFVACHPIAGTEFSGPMAAQTNLFYQKTIIFCEIEKTSPKIAHFAHLIFNQLGSVVELMDAISHDLHIAYVSHLSHISSFMLGKTVIEKEKDEKNIFNLAGSGFSSTVRLAKSSPTTWSSIFKDNATNISIALNEYIENLTAFKTLLDTQNYEQVYIEMQNVNKIKTILKE